MFEVLEKDLAGRIGILETKHGKIETPAIAPVINPAKNILPPSSIVEIGFPLLMTNAYIIKRHYEDLAIELGVHRILGVEKPVMTDSGAYQFMIYGKIEVTPEEILEFERAIGSDIGVILDLPTPPGISKDEALRRVEETLKRAEKAVGEKTDDMLLVGPIQGGVYIDLVEYSAKKLSKLDFDVYAIGGFTQLMEQYTFTCMVKAVVAAKQHLPPSKPLHLFGGGNPVMLPLAVALGVDLFDSASYALYAKDLRYMTSHGVLRFERLRELPCECPVCSKYSVEDLRDMPREELECKIALHNLYVLSREIKTIKQAIHEGWLWELLEEKAARQHSLMDALLQLRKYLNYLEKHHPITKHPVRGLNFSSVTSLWRPEIYRHLKRLYERYEAPVNKILLLLPETREKPYTRFGPIAFIYEIIKERNLSYHIVVYSPIFGIIPIELSEVYPLSQYNASRLLANDPEKIAFENLLQYLRFYSDRYKEVVLVIDQELVRLSDEGISRLKLEVASLKVLNYPISSIKSKEHGVKFLKELSKLNVN